MVPAGGDASCFWVLWVMAESQCLEAPLVPAWNLNISLGSSYNNITFIVNWMLEAMRAVLKLWAVAESRHSIRLQSKSSALKFCSFTLSHHSLLHSRCLLHCCLHSRSYRSLLPLLLLLVIFTHITTNTLSFSFSSPQLHLTLIHSFSPHTPTLLPLVTSTSIF